jgi:hypothetical protein
MRWRENKGRKNKNQLRNCLRSSDEQYHGPQLQSSKENGKKQMGEE